ncbi:hypothetical protein GOP47_0007174 [Adiantum capillus-veneris]|uniref:Uncharacterized protein n=1 Tax=Adiantum capillus-veneris TaxID=13818 RepID=A0A9D4ZLN0_ADICA|nr:hypothetical protein GOP47_0007174 [Adiantum capillus-veneris]
MTSSYQKLQGKVAIITGGASGIGEATACLFVEHGASVVIADVQDTKGIETASKLGLHLATYMHCDVSSELDVENLIAFTIQTYGKLDIMFNNAGVWGKVIAQDVRDMDVEDFNYVMSTNVRGMALGIKHASKAMVEANIKGSIICNASISSILGDLDLPLAYTVSKHAILGLVRATASQLGKFGIRVNCVSPGAVHTPLLSSYIHELSSSTCMPSTKASQYSLLKPVDIAKAVFFLASDDSTAMNGTNLVLDEGYSSMRVAM